MLQRILLKDNRRVSAQYNFTKPDLIAFLPVLLLLLHMYSTVNVTAIKVIARSTNVTEGEDASLLCQLIDTQEQLSRIKWQRKTKENPTTTFFYINPDGTTERVNILSNRVDFIGNIKEINGSILLRKVTLSDQGTYTCTFNIFPSGLFEKEITLTVLVPPVVSVNTNVTLVDGQCDVILATCTAAQSLPAADVSWRLGTSNNFVKVQTNMSVDPDGFYTVRSQLIGAASKKLNNETVECVVNHIGMKKEQVESYPINIHYPPQIVYIISAYATTTSQEFQCIADSNPPPTKFTWKRENKSLSNSLENGRIIIPLTSKENGLYTCEASNQYGKGIGTIYIHISSESPLWMSFFFILLFLTPAVFVAWKYNFIGKLTKFFSELRERFQHAEHIQVPTVSGSPSTDGSVLNSGGNL